MDEQLKRRLVGAAIIMLLAVVVVPLFFEEKPPKDPSTLPEAVQEHPLALPADAPEPAAIAGVSTPAPTTPATAQKKRKYEVVPLDDTPAKPAKVEPELQGQTVTGAAPAPADPAPYSDEEVENTAPTPRVVATPPVSSSKPKLSPKKPSSAAETQTAKPKTQTSAADSHNHADPLKKPETGTGAKTAKSIASSATKSTPATRTATVAPAKKASAPLVTNADKTATKKPVPATTTAKPKQTAGEKSSWTVQAGTFAEESNARNLVEKLRKRNLPAKVHTIDGSAGTVYRVTVGSGLDRSHAEKIQKELSSQDGVSGAILQSR